MVVRLKKHANITMPDIDAAIAFLKANPSDRTRSPVCVIIHAVFAGSAYEDILAAGAARVITTDSIPHQTNVISLADPLAASIAHAMNAKVETPNGLALGPQNEFSTELKT